MVDHSTGRSRGFGFVTFESEDAVERVMSDGRMHDLGGKQVTSFLLLYMRINIFLLLQLLDSVALATTVNVAVEFSTMSIIVPSCVILVSR